MSDGFEITGVKELIKALDALPDKAVKKVVRPAVTKAGRIVVKAAKQNVPVEYGILKKSMISKVKTYNNGAIVAIVGANAATVGTISTPDGKTETRRPVNYLHLVEFGTSKTAPNPFMRRADSQTAGEVTNKIETEVLAGIQKIAGTK